MLVFFELVGNDVCNHKSFKDMTSPEEFKKHILTILSYLDSVLPKGSHVWIFGLVDGRVLYDNLHNDIHPLNITYTKVYDYLNCLGISPCWGWLNSNETVRNMSTDHAMLLNSVYSEILAEKHNYNNFDLAYYDFPAKTIMDLWVSQGGKVSDLVERIDGFHPNQRFNAMLADWIWQQLETDHPAWIGSVNPHNEIIDSLTKH